MVLVAAVSGFFEVGELGQPDPPAYDRLGEVRVPAVVVRGDREYPMVADCADAIASRIPAAATSSSPEPTTCFRCAPRPGWPRSSSIGRASRPRLS